MISPKASVDRSLGYRETTLAGYDAAEMAAPSEKERAKIRHYKRGLEEAIARLRVKAARLDDMIATRASSMSTPRYGTVFSILVCPSKIWMARKLPVAL